LVQGPYLVRSAHYDKEKKALHLTGDEDESKSITVFAPPKLCSITWNGDKVAISARNGNMYVVDIKGPETDFELPALGPWTWADGLPEISEGYEADSDAWVGTFNAPYSIIAV
jgi:hypothetical protein